MAEVDDFVTLHTHSDMSQLDGCGTIGGYVKAAKERGHRAIAITDHGTMRGYMKLHEATEEHGIKPIYGIEFYVSPDMRRRGLTDEEKAEVTKGLKKAECKDAIKNHEERMGIRDRWHICAWARDDVGLRNLYKLSSAAFMEGFYYKPRIDVNELEKYSEGVMISTGCLSSPVNDSWNAGKRRQALEYADRLHGIFADRLWFEVQPHAIADQRVANALMLKLAERYGGTDRLLATQDAHYIEQSDWEHHEILLCIGTGSNLDDPNRFKFDGNEFHFRRRKEMAEAFARHHEFMPSHLVKKALDNTLAFADQCTAKVVVDWRKALLPEPGIPESFGHDTFAYLKHLCLTGWAWRDMPQRVAAYAAREGIDMNEATQRYTARLKHEMGALKRQGFVNYFLIVRDIYAFAREQRHVLGPGRGSVAGSLVAYLLGITAIDPIEHGLIFERFINPHRIDMPDCDMDFEDRRRHEIIEYIRRTYGDDKVCQIATIGKLSGKQCLIDVSRVLDVPLMRVRQVTSSIIERSSGDERASQTIVDSFKDFDVCKKFNEDYPKVLYHAQHLEGMAKNLGIHAAGVIASSVPLTDVIPLEVRKHDGADVVVSATDMYAVAAVGLVKFDILGLRTLSVIHDALTAIEERHGRVIDMESVADVDLQDQRVLGAFTAHDYGGIFQYDTPSADKVCMGVNFDTFEDVAAMTALNRPGTSRSGLATKYVERKKNPALVAKVDFHPMVSEITKDTLGILVYQEHVIRIFTEIAGFAPGTADSLRKTIAKKIGDETLGREREAFVEGALKHTPGMTKDVANRIMDAITFFGSYGFNKSHATAYGMIAYWCMWLKVYYPLEFYWALMRNEPDRIRVQQIAKDAKRHGIPLLPPHVSVSNQQFSIDDGLGAIRGSLVDIKGVGEKAAAAVIAAQPYTDIVDFADRVDRRQCNRGAVAALAKAGALDDMFPNIRWLVDNMERYWGTLTKPRSQKSVDALDAMLEEAQSVPDYTDEERQFVTSSVNPLAFGNHPIDAYKLFMEEQVRVELADMGDENFFKDYDNKGCFVAGVVVEVKYNQIGDFHTGELPSELERKRQFWGARYANVNIEDKSGKQNRFKFDIDVFDDLRPIIDLGVGSAILVHATASNFTGTLRVQFAVDMEGFRTRVRSGEAMTMWERVISGQHPAVTYPWPDERKANLRITNEAFWHSQGGGVFCGLVTNVKLKYDRKGGLMAYAGMISGDLRYIEVVIFASVWVDAKRVFKAGRLLKLELERQPDKRRGWSYLYTGGRVEWLKRAEVLDGGELDVDASSGAGGTA